MISLDVAARQIAGAWKMAFAVETWRDDLDRSIDGVFSSFAAFAFSLPLVMLFTLSAKRAAERAPELADSLYRTAPLAPLIIGDLIVYALDWAASITLLVMLARALGAGKLAADLIVGYNWIQPIVAAIQLPSIAIMASTASGAVGGALGIPAFSLTIVLIWGIVRRGLGAQASQAAAIVAMLVIVGAVIDIFGAAAMRTLTGDQS